MFSEGDQICASWGVKFLTTVMSSDGSVKRFHVGNRTVRRHVCESGRICIWIMLIERHWHSKQVIFLDALSGAWPPSHYQNKDSHPFLLPLFQRWLRGLWMHGIETSLSSCSVTSAVAYFSFSLFVNHRFSQVYSLLLEVFMKFTLRESRKACTLRAFTCTLQIQSLSTGLFLNL